MNNNEAVEAISKLDGDNIEVVVFETPTLGQQVAAAGIQIAVGIGATLAVGGAMYVGGKAVEKFQQLKELRQARKAQKAYIETHETPQD